MRIANDEDGRPLLAVAPTAPSARPEELGAGALREESLKLARYIWKNVIALSDEPPKHVVEEIQHSLVALAASSKRKGAEQ
jgi:hypothetical protein